MRGGLTPDKVAVIRHRAINLRRATDKAAVECQDLLHQVLDVDAVIELTDSWMRQRQDKLRRISATSAAIRAGKIRRQS